MCDEYHRNVIDSSSLALIKARNIQNKNLEEQLKIKISIYYKSPKICPKCNENISFEKRNNKFCSRKCGNSRIHTEESKQKTSTKLKKPEKCTIYIKNCNKCYNLFVASPQKGNSKNKVCIKCKDTHRIKLCIICNKNSSIEKGKYCKICVPNISLYRSRAAFNFNIYEFPEEFDLNLIEEHGWYSPNGYKRRNKKPNLSGVSRDHIYSVLDGFTNNIDPCILSHPANCRIMVHNGSGGNNSKNRKSEITIDVLLERIKEWNLKYGVPPQI